MPLLSINTKARAFVAQFNAMRALNPTFLRLHDPLDGMDLTLPQALLPFVEINDPVTVSITVFRASVPPEESPALLPGPGLIMPDKNGLI